MDIAYTIKGGSFSRLRQAVRALRRSAISACALLVVPGLVDAAALTDVEFVAQEGGRFQVRLDFDDVPPEPTGYQIERPARIALDFPGVSSELKQKKHALSYGNASSAVILESGGRTRMILNLIELAPYTSEVRGNSVFINVGDSGARDYLKPIKGSSVLSKALSKPVDDVVKSTNAIQDIDFKRGELGEGKLEVALGSAKTDINVYVEGEEIKVDFKGTEIPERLQRRFDVVDFATPVQQVEAIKTQEGTTFSIRATGEYDYLAYQADNNYVISVKPLTPEEVEERKKEFAYVGEKLSLNFQDIPVRAVLQLIADFTGLNLVASDSVSGNITLRLQNVPWDQALDLVLKTKGLDKRQIGNVLMVGPAAEIAERERQEIANNKQVEELAPLQTEHVRVRYAEARELYKLFDTKSRGGKGVATNSILSPRGSVIVDERTNSLLVTETAQKLAEFRRVVKLLDVPVKQVLIEARIVIANSDFDEQLGIRWGVGGRTEPGGQDLYFGRSSEEVFDAHNTNVDAIQEQIDAGIPPSIAEQIAPVVFPSATRNVDLGIGGATGQFAVGYIQDNYHLGMELSALESQGRGEIVSQPKIITGDKQEAVIKSGTEVPYQESSANGETTISFKEAVLKLEVTPSITPDDRIIMKLVITQDSVGDLVPSGSLGGFVPTIDTTELETQVLVGNGETVVLGGVFRTEDVKSEAKIPFLGDIPYVGRLFKQTSVRQVKAETLIFITPRILADALID